jgi:hypothetical protein
VNAKIVVSNWKPFENNTLKAFFSIVLPSGLILNKCSLHQKDGHRWIGLPSERYKKQDGTVAYAKLVEFTSREVADRFRNAVVQVLKSEGHIR